MYLGGSDLPAHIRGPRDAVRLGVALLTEDRKGQGLLLPRPIRENVTLAGMRTVSGPGGWIRGGLEALVAKRWVDRLAVRCANADQAAGELSGGNQQKVVLAKWLASDADVFIFDEPTRGIDVESKASIHDMIRDLTRRGIAVLMVSSELPEIIGMSDRILVMWDGRIAGELPAKASEQEIMLMATGHTLKNDAKIPVTAGKE